MIHVLLHSSHSWNNYVYHLFLISMKSNGWICLISPQLFIKLLKWATHGRPGAAHQKMVWIRVLGLGRMITKNIPPQMLLENLVGPHQQPLPPLPQWEGLPPTPSKGAEEDFQGPGGSECRICQKFVRGGRWAMRSHQIASSRRLAARDGSFKAREPCADCGRSLAADDWWAKQQHQQQPAAKPALGA